MEDRKELERIAAERIQNVRADLILSQRFYGVLVANVEPKPSWKFPTMATDSKTHYYNPAFIAGMSHEEALTVQEHESEHDARHHSTRRGGRDPEQWNIACDYAINIDLVDAGRKFPATINGKPFTPYVDEKYRGMSAEEIYRSRELDEQRAEQERRRKQEEEEKNDADTGAGAEDSDGKADESSEPQAGGDEEEADSGADQGAGDQAGEGAEDQANGDEAGDDDSASAAGDGTGEGEAEGQGEGETEASGNGGDGNDQRSSGDPGGLGEVIDASNDVGETTVQDQNWERIVRQAASLSKKRGDLPGHVLREVDRAAQPQQNWREALRQYFDAGAAQVETWNRPNRRFIGSGIMLPGTQRDGLNTVVFLIDTSGSCDEVALAQVGAEAQAALDENIIDKLIVVYGDAEVTRTDEYGPGDVIEFDPRGGGGTMMQPLFQWVAENVDSVSLIVCFTDLFIESEAELGEQPAAPVLWAVHGYPQQVRELIANAPWGAPGIDVGDHYA